MRTGSTNSGIDSEPTTEARQQLVLHRRMHVRRDQLCSLAASAFGNTRTALRRAPLRDRRDADRSAARCSTSRRRESGLIASTQISSGRCRRASAPEDPSARSWNEPSSMVPDRQRQRRQRLEVLPRQVLLPVAEVDRLAYLGELGQRVTSTKPAPRAFVSCADRCCRTGTPSSRGSRAAWRRGPSGTGAPTAEDGSATGSVAHEPPSTTCHCAPAEPVRLREHDTVADHGSPGLPPTTRRGDQVVPRTAELRAPCTAGPARR